MILLAASTDVNWTGLLVWGGAAMALLSLLEGLKRRAGR